LCINTRDGMEHRLNELQRKDIVTLGDILCGYIQHPEIKSLGPNGEKCTADTRGLLQRMAVNGGLHLCIGKEVSRFEQGKDDFIENIDDICIHYDGGRVSANESLLSEIRECGLRKTTKWTGLDRKTIRRILNRENVKSSTLVRFAIGLRRSKIQPQSISDNGKKTKNVKHQRE
jgi:lambda repressor-like predicted transcriptional regulator